MSARAIMKPLELTTFPLQGLSLIEASAGTGKTYTLANLYLRYLLESNYSVEQILVVTFTDAATQELRDRIRARIVELGALFDTVISWRVAETEVTGKGIENADGLEAQLTQYSSDPLLQHMVLQSANLREDRMRLTIAERHIDLAEIHTIHGFCQKVINENAVALGLATNQRLQEDMKLMHLDVCEDIWRRFILKLPCPQLSFVSQNWASPEALLHAVVPMLQRQPEVILPELPVADPNNDATGARLDDWAVQFDTAFKWEAQLKKLLLDQGQAALEDLQASGVNRVKNKVDWFNKSLAWAESDKALFDWPRDSKKECYFWRLTHAALASDLRKNGKAPTHPFFAALAILLDSAPAPITHGFILAIYETLKREVALRKSADSLLAFDDLILKIEQALLADESRTETEVEDFSALLRQQYCTALIDEFQDTDKAQYHIFSRIFGPKAGDGASNLVLIGDPKQAIYGFRGGDMATYLRAKHEVENHAQGSCFTMTQNWRSSPEMVQAANEVFMLHPNPFMESAIPFVEVNAAKDSSNQDWPSALTITQVPAFDAADGKPLKKDRIEESLALACVSDVLSLLLRQEELGLKSSDIAILVRTRSEAAYIKTNLASAGIRASYDVRQSVFDSPEASAALYLLEAVSEPRNETKIKRCIVEIMFGYTDQQFESLYTDQSALGSLISSFETLNQIWVKQGVLSMVRHALTDLDVLSNWRKEIAGDESGSAAQQFVSNNWERVLTNFNQIAELLQVQSRKLRGHHALIRWLHREIVDERTEGDDAYTMRLESDEDLIQIVTVHQSKGLEYPVVFLPFQYSAKKSQDAWYYDDDKKLCLSLEPTDEQSLRAEQERQAEDIRLMYVALTRAKYCCFIGTSAYQGHAKALGCKSSAWGRLVLGASVPDTLDDGLYTEALQILADKADCKVRQTSNEEIIQEYEKNLRSLTAERTLRDTGKDAENLHARLISRSLYHDWRVNSFTAWMNEHHDRMQAHGTGSRSRIGDVQGIAAQQDIHILNFPRGSEAGTFLHTLFEGIEFSTGELSAKLSRRFADRTSYIEDLLRKKMLVPERNVSAWAVYLDRWLTETLGLPIMKSFALNQLQSTDYLVEMSFHFQVGHQQASEFNRIVQSYNPAASPLYFSGFEGHIKGAIDLIFRQDDCYYILDYKSNHLGFDEQSYSQAALSSSMAEHRYDVQYLLYSVALHRFLGHRLGTAYDYEKDFGGVFYLFLRGMAIESVSAEGEQVSGSSVDSELSGIYYTRPDKALIDELDALLREGVSA